jgi:hypothetical protein
MFTDSDPRKPLIRKTLEHAHYLVCKEIATRQVKLPNETELFIQLYPAEDETWHQYAGYYLIDHDNQLLFWATPTSTSDLAGWKVNPNTFDHQHLSKLQV